MKPTCGGGALCDAARPLPPSEHRASNGRNTSQEIFSIASLNDRWRSAPEYPQARGARFPAPTGSASDAHHVHRYSVPGRNGRFWPHCISLPFVTTLLDERLNDFVCLASRLRRAERVDATRPDATATAQNRQLIEAAAKRGAGAADRGVTVVVKVAPQQVPVRCGKNAQVLAVRILALG